MRACKGACRRYKLVLVVEEIREASLLIESYTRVLDTFSRGQDNRVASDTFVFPAFDSTSRYNVPDNESGGILITGSLVRARSAAALPSLKYTRSQPRD